MTPARADRPACSAILRLGHAGALESENRWIDCQPDFDTAHYTKGFAWPERQIAFKRTGRPVPFPPLPGLARPGRRTCSALPDHWEVIRGGDGWNSRFRLGPSPARQNFLNLDFQTRRPTSHWREKPPDRE
jgi:hypothetical protein